ncbi:MAG: hypothetical protein ACTSPW_14660 [Promethearchaeota archaeon]
MQLPLYLGEIILQYLYRQTEQGKEEFDFKEVFDKLKEHDIIVKVVNFSRILQRMAKKGWIKKAEGRKYFTKILLTESGIREAERVSMTIKIFYQNIINGIWDKRGRAGFHDD